MGCLILIPVRSYHN